MNSNERISQLEEMMSETLKRLDAVTAQMAGLIERLDRSDARQQTILEVLVRQTDTNTAMLRKLTDHETRLGNLENPGPKNAA